MCDVVAVDDLQTGRMNDQRAMRLLQRKRCILSFSSGTQTSNEAVIVFKKRKKESHARRAALARDDSDGVSTSVDVFVNDSCQ